MLLSIQAPKKSLNKAYLKEKVGRAEIEAFKKQFVTLLARINEGESEENNKNIVADFLKNTWYKEQYEINTKGRADLVIHTGKTANDPVGVILEVKKPSNRAEMISVAKPNTKALQELVLYYLRERIDHDAKLIRHLIITNIWEWYLIDEVWFEQHVYGNAGLRKDYEAYKLSGKSTQFFYDSIAKPFLEKVNTDLPCTYFDIRSYEATVSNANSADDHKLIALYKILSPVHLLKEKFANDSNSLDKRFYEELLHIIGLEEVKEGGKKLIKRKAKPDEASLLENTLSHIDERDSLYEVDNYSSFGTSRGEQQLGISLELCITWINRILFMKLLEAQLARYHRGDKAYLFLNTVTIHDYDELSNLFFGVLAERPDSRKARLKDKFRLVPYLNSSLFERTPLERQALEISALDNQLQSPIAANTVLKDDKGKKRTGALTTLEYLFRFLDAYDFSSEGSEEIQEENKNLINASVLGLIFEKINGYKDGSFFTPGFVTMYMCRETIRRAVYQKFREAKGWEVDNMDALHNLISDKKEANVLINSITICDPAVGSGHFLVSALNELIAIKSELKILLDGAGKTLRDYEVLVVNDELIITDDDGQLYEYNPNNAESRRVQQALFHEKEILIEHCLFGVDINPNSVKICRLRLWIELLKNAYYTAESTYTELETLPNIDINIKTGNSLISRFALDADLGKALKSLKWDIAAYRGFVHDYKNATGKEEKRGLEKLIEGIKKDFRTEIGLNDTKRKRLNKISGEYEALMTQQQMFALSKAEAKVQKASKEKLAKEIEKLSTELEEIKSNKIYENAFEWRFEFPEVLDDEGRFIGFDVVIGNPPYIRQEEFTPIKEYLKEHYAVFAGTADLLTYFIEKGLTVLKPEGQFNFIIANKFMRAGFGKALRGWLQQFSIASILDFGDLPVFEDATTYPCILSIEKKKQTGKILAATIDEMTPENFAHKVQDIGFQIEQKSLAEEGWNLADDSVHKLMAKIRNAGVPLGEYVGGKIYYGIKTGLNEAFVIDVATRERLIAEDAGSADVIKPFLAGRDIKRYQQPKSEKFLIFTRRGINIDNYPAILKHLEGYRESLEPLPKDWKGDLRKGRKPGNYKWYEIQDSVDYYAEFEKPKIMLPDIALRAEACLVYEPFFVGNTAYIIPVEDEYLVAILNSKVVDFFYRNLTSSIRGGYLRFIRQYLEQIPIPKNTDTDFAKLPLAQLDKVIFENYKLTAEEIGLINGQH